MKYKGKTKLAEWQDNSKNGVCPCGEKRDVTVDHIIPVHFLEQFCLDKIEVLYNFEENFQYLCRYCNRRKGAQLDPKNPKTYSLLRKVLDDAEKYFLTHP